MIIELSKYEMRYLLKVLRHYRDCPSKIFLQKPVYKKLVNKISKSIDTQLREPYLTVKPKKPEGSDK